MFGFFKSKPRDLSKAVSPAVLRSNSSGQALQSVHSYKKKFDYELNSWCFGLEKLGEEPLPQVVFRVVREFRTIFAEAIASGYVFDIDFAARKIFEASQKVVPLKEIAMAFVAILPEPENLPLDQKRVFTLILAQVELSHAGAVDRVRQRIQPAKTTEKAQEEGSGRQAPQAPPLLAGRV
jgi:hypothetical protein